MGPMATGGGGTYFRNDHNGIFLLIAPGLLYFSETLLKFAFIIRGMASIRKEWAFISQSFQKGQKIFILYFFILKS
jgi:hypothetical protein